MRHYATLCLVALTNCMISSQEIDEVSALTQYQDLVQDRKGRSAWTGRSKSPQCRGTVTTLKKDEATVLKSHYGYGKEPYPENYQCRWLFIPDDCNLGIECDVGTSHNRRRGKSLDKCVDGDYLRVLGYRGTTDKFFCGKKGFNLTFAGQDAVALMFRSLDRDESAARNGLLSSIFGGFNCKIVCKNPEANVLSGTGLEPPPPPVTTTTPSTTAKPEAEDKIDTEDQFGNCKCGETRQGRIVCPDGHNCTAELGSIPWQAAIVNKHRSQPWCGAAIINDQYVLTAGHCLHTKAASKLQVVLGDHDWTTKSEIEEQRFNVDHVKIHPRFGKVAQFDFDFALVKLSRKIDFNSRVRPVCLPSLGRIMSSDFLIGQFAQVSGWGVVDPSNPRRQARRLQKVNVKIMTNSECKAKYTFNPVTDNMMCAAYADRDACFGDSGGPMTVIESGVAVLEGVISWGKNCAKPQWPGVYARVRNVMPWILQNTLDAQYCQMSSRASKSSDISRFEHELKRRHRKA